MIRRLSLGTCCACALVILLSPSVGIGKPRPQRSPSPAPAADVSPAPTAADAAGSAHLRLWKACEAQGDADLQIRLLSESGNGKDGGWMSANKDPYQFTGYDEVPAGPGVIELTLAGQPPTRLGVNLAKGQDYTVVVRAQHGAAAAELLSDSRLGDTDPAFSVYSLLFGGKGDVQVTLGDALMAHLNTAGGRLRARGIKADFYQVTVSGKDGKGQPFRWNAETDLRKVSRSALVISLDVYGRIRPQLIEDGPATEAALPAAKAPASPGH